MKTPRPSPNLFQSTLVVALAIVIVSVFSVSSAQAFEVTLDQVGSNVVATGSGAFDLTGLIPNGTNLTLLAVARGINPMAGVMGIGPSAASQVDQYIQVTAATTFGSGGLTSANIGSGDLLGFTHINTFNVLVVPTGYVSGTALSDSMTFDNATFASLGVTPGTYEWTWGTAANQNFTIDVIAPAGVPDLGSTLGLLFFALVGLFGASRFSSLRLA